MCMIQVTTSQQNYKTNKMSVHCYKCASSFGLFNKEIGCRKCGFAFCKKCVSKKATLANKSKPVSVCDTCYDIATGKKPPVNAAQYSPPEALAKRLAAAEKNQSGHSQPSATQSSSKSSSPSYSGMSKQDVELAKRLEKLREERKAGATSIPSQNEIESRLAGLKGSSTSQSSTTDRDVADRLAAIRGQKPTPSGQPFVYRVDNRTAQEQIDSLLEEIGNEVGIDSRLEADRVQSIEERLGRLRGEGGQSEAASSGQNSDLQNNLNMQPAAKPYSDKLRNWNISSKEAEDDSEKASDWLEVKRMMESVSRDLDADASKAVAELRGDKELWDRVKDLKKSKKERKSSAEARDDDKDDNDDDDDSEDDEKVARNICKQILEEIRIEDSLDEPATKQEKEEKRKTTKKKKTVTKSKVRPESPSSDGSELTWCCICNEDATLRCRACDNDLYCERCFKEGHSKHDLKDGHAPSYLKKR